MSAAAGAPRVPAAAMGSGRARREAARELWLERVLLPFDVAHLLGPRRVEYGPDELLVVCLERNAEAHIGSFIGHYLELGVRHIVLLDNGSTDGTVAAAARHPHVSVFRTTLPFRGNNCAMRRYLVRRFARAARWVLCVDADELFDYPLSGRVPLASLLRYLRSRRYTAMAAHMLDMFSDRPVTAPAPPALPLKEAFPLYDLSGVRRRGYFEDDGYGALRFVRHNRLDNPEIGRYVGGVRAAPFALPEVYLIKHPLTFRDGRVRITHQHFVDHAAVADVSGVLYHYKFAEGFAARVAEAVRTGAYADDSFEYRRYQEALARDPRLRLDGGSARRLGGVDELVAAGFLQVSAAYREWADAAGAA
jgi:glycosyltransferase involved in cell wall biosynthesis